MALQVPANSNSAAPAGDRSVREALGPVDPKFLMMAAQHMDQAGRLKPEAIDPALSKKPKAPK